MLGGGPGRVFGKRNAAAVPSRPALASGAASSAIFSRELWDGKLGGFLRDMGLYPDEPRNKSYGARTVAELVEAEFFSETGL